MSERSHETEHRRFAEPDEVRELDDGTGLLAGAAEITSLPGGHDAWVLGHEPVVVDWYGASSYARAR